MDGMSDKEDTKSITSEVSNARSEKSTRSGATFTTYGGNRSSKNAFGSVTTLSSGDPTDISDETDDHVSVALRVRPLTTQEVNRNDTNVISFPGDGTVVVAGSGSQRQFTYNIAFEPDATQEDVFCNVGIKRLIDMGISGYSCTAFAFGQTGSGKTHTMTGPPHQFQGGQRPDRSMEGLIQRSFRYLLDQLKQQPGHSHIIRASYLEIYNEQVIDLLNQNHRRQLTVRWSKNKGFYVENLFVIECETMDDLLAVLEEGLNNRATGSQSQNEFSSRSHSMLSLMIHSETQDKDDENLYITMRGKITFVDLAGSEKVKDLQSGETQVESNNINKSLLVLGNCISSLSDPRKRQGHIPYRDSKLTKLLSDSLSGNGVTLMIACISPSSQNVTETTNTLRYASRAKKITSKPVVKMDPRELLIINLKKEIKVLRNENHYLRQQLEFPAKPRGQLQKENDKKFIDFMKDQTKTDKMVDGSQPDASLYEMLQEYMVENEALRSENSDLHNTRERIRREQQLLYRENEKLVKRLETGESVHSMTEQGSWPHVSRHGSLPSPGYASFESSPAHTPVFQDTRNLPLSQRPVHVHAGNGMTSPTTSHSPVTHGVRQLPPPQAVRRPPHRLPQAVTRPTALPVSTESRNVIAQPLAQQSQHQHQQQLQQQQHQHQHQQQLQHNQQPPLHQQPSYHHQHQQTPNKPRPHQQPQHQQLQNQPLLHRPAQNQMPVPRTLKPPAQAQRGPRNANLTAEQPVNTPRAKKDETAIMNDQLAQELSALDSEIRHQQAVNRSQHATIYNT